MTKALELERLEGLCSNVIRLSKEERSPVPNILTRKALYNMLHELQRQIDIVLVRL